MGRKSCLNGRKIRGCSDALKNWLHSVHASSRFGPEPSTHHRPPSPSMPLGNLCSYVSPDQYPAYVGSDPFDDSNLHAADRGAEVVVAPLGGRESGSPLQLLAIVDLARWQHPLEEALRRSAHGMWAIGQQCVPSHGGTSWGFEAESSSPSHALSSAGQCW